MHFLKGTHCNISFFQQVKNMLKIKLQDALVFSVGFLWLWNPEECLGKHLGEKSSAPAPMERFLLTDTAQFSQLFSGQKQQK